MQGVLHRGWWWTRALIDNLAILTAAAFTVVLGVAYFALHAPHLPWLRPLLTAAGALMDGYDVESLELAGHVQPAKGDLSAQAQLRIRPREDFAGILAFLLDPGFRVEAVSVVTEGGRHQPLKALQLGPIVSVGPLSHKGDSLVLSVRYSGHPLAFGSLRDARVGVDQLLLPPDALWYPTNARSFFTFRARVELPADWQLVHAASEASTYQRGQTRIWEWKSERPVSGLGLLAGAYRIFARSVPASELRVFARPEDARLAEVALDRAEAAYSALRNLFGTSGFPAMALVLHPTLSRAFFDGAGVIGLPRASLANADRGFGLVAHELAHAWWGGTTSGHWLSGGSGGQWVTESLAEVSSLLASEAAGGPDARVRRTLNAFTDPAYRMPPADMTVLDNALGPPGSRETIYGRGTLVAWMLRSLVGEERFLSVLRTLLERYRYRSISDREVQSAFEEGTGQSLEWFFAGFVRGSQPFDLQVDVANGGALEVRLPGSPPFPGKIRLWRRTLGQTDWQETHVEVPHQLRPALGNEEVLVDPMLEWPDVQRENNRYPRRSDPLFVTAAGDQWLVVNGEPFAWSRQTAQLMGAVRTPHPSWLFERGFLEPPTFDPEHGWFVATISEPAHPLPSIVLLETDGGRRALGRGRSPVLATDGAVLAAVDDRIVRIGPSGRLSTVLRHPGSEVGPIAIREADPQLAYVVRTPQSTAVYVSRTDGKTFEEAQPVWQWERAPVRVRWISNEDTLLIAAVDGETWRLWEVPLAAEPSVEVARDVYALADFAVSADGRAVALVAASLPVFPRGTRQIYVLDRLERTTLTVEAPEHDFLRVSWLNPTTLLAVSQVMPTDGPLYYPRERVLQQIRLPHGQVEPMAIRP